MSTIIDVARKAGVSPATVSNVRTGKKKVSPEIVKRVNDAIEELHYIPNAIASGLRGQSTSIIGVVMPSFYHPFHTSMLKGIQDVAINTNYTICAFPTYTSQEIEYKCLQQLESIMPDGILISSYAMPNDVDGEKCLDLLRGFAEKPIPVISMERDFSGEKGICSVFYDNEAASRNVLEYLVAIGHERIGFIGGPVGFEVSMRRKKGYLETLRKYDLECNPDWIYAGEYLGETGYKAMNQILSKPRTVTAVFCANDEIAIGALKAVKEHGLRVPSDIAVVGFDNIYVGTLIDPPLTTVDVPAYEIGRKAISILLSQLQGSAFETKSVEIETSLIKRRSSELGKVSEWELL